MKEAIFTFFNEFTSKDEKTLRMFDKALTHEEFAELYAKAKSAYASAPHSDSFDNSQVFISGASSLNGFYFPNNKAVDPRTGYKLLLIAFKVKHHYDLKNHKKQPNTLEALPIYSDDEKLYTLKSYTLDNSPLERWQNELKDLIKDYKKKLEGWAQVKRVYKKDGTPFKNLQKNFEGVTIKKEQYFTKQALQLHLYTGDYLGGCTSDVIYDTPNTPLFNIDDVIPAIQKAMALYQQHIDEAQKELDFSETIYADIMCSIVDKLIKYSTPTNRDGVAFKHLSYTFRRLFNKLYISI